MSPPTPAWFPVKLGQSQGQPGQSRNLLKELPEQGKKGCNLWFTDGEQRCIYLPSILEFPGG